MRLEIETCSKTAERVAEVQDPSKPCVKNHHSLVLRTATASDKYQWLARLRNAGDAAMGAKPRSYASSELQRSADSTTSSVAPTPRIRAGAVRSIPPDCC